MTRVRTRTVSARTVAKNRYDEASRVRDAYFHVLILRKRAGDHVGARLAEEQLTAAEALETKAWDAWVQVSRG